jgi:hypothetical protein
MKRIAMSFLLVLLPLAVFAQARMAPDKGFLTQLGLTDAQVSQVMDIQAKTRDAVRQDSAQVQLIRAQINKAMVATTVDVQAVNGLIDQLAQARAGMQKTLFGARVQLQQIMGPDKLQAYLRHIRQQFARGMGRRLGPRMQPGMRDGGDWM